MREEYIRDYQTQKVLGILRYESNGDVYAVDYKTLQILAVYRADQNRTLEYRTQKVVSTGNTVVSFIYQR